MPHRLQAGDPWLVDSLVVPVSLRDVDGRLVRMNAAAERASGYSTAEMLGRRHTDPLHPEARENAERQFRRAVERGEPTDFETVFVDAGGRVRGVRFQYLPLRENDAIIGVLTLAFDVRRPATEPIRLRPDPHLTPRQREILGLIASGQSTEEVARDLAISPETVRNHLRSVYKELRAHTRVEAIARAQRLGLLAAPALGPQPPDAGI